MRFNFKIFKGHNSGKLLKSPGDMFLLPKAKISKCQIAALPWKTMSSYLTGSVQVEIE